MLPRRNKLKHDSYEEADHSQDHEADVPNDSMKSMGRNLGREQFTSNLGPFDLKRSPIVIQNDLKI